MSLRWPAAHGGALGERFGPALAEHLVASTQVLAGVHTSVLTTQPLAVQQVRAGQMDGDAAARKMVDRRAVAGLGGGAVAQQSA